MFAPLALYDRARTPAAPYSGCSRTTSSFTTGPQPVVNGRRGTMTTAGGQQLFVTSLLPANGVMSAEELPREVSGNAANLEFIRFRLRVEAPAGPQSVRFLHVLQGANAGATADSATPIETAGFSGAVVRGTAILFPTDLSAPFTTLTYTVPSAVSSHRVTGLTANGAYGVTTRTVGPNIEVTITSGGTLRADSAGVLTFGDVTQVPGRRRPVRH